MGSPLWMTVTCGYDDMALGNMELPELQTPTPGLAQIYFSRSTVEMLRTSVLQAHCKKVAFLSVPAVYFHMSSEERREHGCRLFEFDRQWDGDEGFIFYDCYKPTDLSDTLYAQFDFLIADPPKLTREVLENYAATIKLLAAPQAKIVFSTMEAHSGLMLDMLSLFPRTYRPFLPGFAWSEDGHYAFFTNFNSPEFSVHNTEFDQFGLVQKRETDETVDEYWWHLHGPEHEI